MKGNLSLWAISDDYVHFLAILIVFVNALPFQSA